MSRLHSLEPAQFELTLQILSSVVTSEFLTLLASALFERGRGRQHCRLSICENWLSWTNTETAAATPPTVMQNLLRASAQ